MNISKLKIAFKYLFGGMEAVVDYLLDIVNQALAAIDPTKRKKIAAAYNTLCKVLATMTSLAWLVPTKWQSAYKATLGAVADAADALADFKIESAELTKVRDAFNAAVLAWRGGDVPDTDVDFGCCDDCEDCD